MFKRFDYQDRCWWCGSQADSKEHKYKRSDLIREFGKGPYAGSDELLRGFDSQTRRIQGPNSNEVKFSNCLCQDCNNRRSQPFDLSYDAFTTYMKMNEQKIWASKQFNLSTIYGANWVVKRDNLVRYYIKHISCRLASERVLIVPEVIDYLNGISTLKYISMNLEIREDIVAMIQHSAQTGIGDGGLWLGDMPCMMSQSTGEVNEVTSFIGYRWIRLNYTYDDRLLLRENSFSTDQIVLQSGYNIEPSTILRMP